MLDDYPDPGHDVEDFRAGSTMAVEFQIHSRNFKATKKTDATKACSFRLLRVYLIVEPKVLMVFTPEKCRRGVVGWLVTPPRTKKTCSSKNRLELTVIEDPWTWQASNNIPFKQDGGSYLHHCHRVVR